MDDEDETRKCGYCGNNCTRYQRDVNNTIVCITCCSSMSPAQYDAYIRGLVK